MVQERDAEDRAGGGDATAPVRQPRFRALRGPGDLLASTFQAYRADLRGLLVTAGEFLYGDLSARLRGNPTPPGAFDPEA